MRTRLLLVPMLLVGSALVVAMSPKRVEVAEFTADFGLEHSEALLPDGGNRWYELRAGRFLRYEGVDEEGRFVEIVHTVLDDVKPVLFEVAGRRQFADTRVVEEREWIDGALAEVSLNFLAHEPQSGNIYYFGERVNLYEHGAIVSHEGSWMAGRDGAQPGLFLPASFLLGSRYVQENAPGRAMDRAENVAMNLVVETPAGTFRDSAAIRESSPLEPDDETLKVYAPGIGAIIDGSLVLVDYGG